MSELYFYLGPKPVRQPIEIRGNWFWKGDERFIIKGINYHLRGSQNGMPATPTSPYIDALTDEHLDDLRRDIHLLHELRLNAISVFALDPTKSHDKAFKLLAEAGIYVLVTIGEGIERIANRVAEGAVFDKDSNLQPHYTPELIKHDLRLVDQLADYPNILAFVVSGNCISMPGALKIAEVPRALIRDVKAFLRQRKGRKPPVGVHNRDQPMYRGPALDYFTAGSPSNRADFFALESWSWAHKSSFQISGWKTLVQNLSTIPVPYFLSEYGTKIEQTRIWEEVECLYSPDMTGILSGGFAYTLHNFGNQHRNFGNRYGIVRFDKKGILRREKDFWNLKERFENVGRKRKMEEREEEYLSEGCKDYEGWRGKFPKLEQRRWKATSDVPDFPMDWETFLRDLEKEKAETT